MPKRIATLVAVVATLGAINTTATGFGFADGKLNGMSVSYNYLD